MVKIINFSEYMVGPKGDGVADDSSFLQAAIDELADGGILELGGADKIYRLNSRVTVQEKTIHLKGDGASLMQGFNGEMFVFNGAFSDPVNVEEVYEDSPTFADSGITRVTVLRATSAQHNFKVGDVVKIVSDDLLEGSRQATGRSGEYSVIQKIEGELIFLSNRLRDIDKYETNVRVAKHLDKTITIDGINLTSALGALQLNWAHGLIVVNGGFRPVLKNIHISDANGPGISMVGCYAYLLDNITATNLTNNPALSQFGYGVTDKGSEYGVATRMHFENVRHGFTNNANNVPAGSNNFWRYGRPAYFTVSDSTAVGTTNAAFDTHEEAYAGQFINCIARGVVKGRSSSGSGFTLRGKRLLYKDCRVYDSTVGWQILSAFAGDTNDILIENCESYGITSATVSVNVGVNGSRIKGVKIRGGKHHTFNKFIFAVDSEVDVRNTDVEAPFESAGLDGPLRVNSADLYFDELRIDMSQSKFSNIQVIKIQDRQKPGNWSIKGRRLEVILPDGVNGFARGDGEDATGRLIVRDLVLNRETPLALNLTGTSVISSSLFD